MVSTVKKNGLEGEFEYELGYSKYDYRNKDADNSRNGYNEKTLKTSLGDIEIAVPRDIKNNWANRITGKGKKMDNSYQIRVDLAGVIVFCWEFIVYYI